MHCFHCRSPINTYSWFTASTTIHVHVEKEYIQNCCVTLRRFESIIHYCKWKMEVSFSSIMMSCWYFQAMKSSGLLNPPFLFMYCLKNKYIKTHYITVTLATLADYIIKHQWESRDLCIETPAEVIGYNNSGWQRAPTVRGLKSWRFNSPTWSTTGIWTKTSKDYCVVKLELVVVCNTAAMLHRNEQLDAVMNICFPSCWRTCIFSSWWHWQHKRWLIHQFSSPVWKQRYFLSYRVTFYSSS